MFDSLARKYRNWRTYQNTVSELSRLSTRELDDLGIARGDMVELFGPNMPVDDVAERAGTIPYELLTSLGARFRRIYRPASGEAGG